MRVKRKDHAMSCATPIATPIRLMLVDDHAVVRAGYRFLLDSLDDVQVVAEASNGEEALRLFPTVLPDVVILDLSMPGMGGREVLDRLQQQWPSSRVLICTMHETTALIDHALQAGAAGYISKNSSPEVLVNAVRKIASGQKYIDGELANNMVVGRGTDAAGGLSVLTPREFGILCLFAEAHSVDDIATKLAISSKTVANNLTIIKEKLQVNTPAELVRLAISKGLVSI
jgi:two-component system, NarL family, invasion response regulator UvrY